MNGLQNKVAIVFAGSRGIGSATAKRLGKEGAIVAVGYVGNIQAATQTVAHIESNGGVAFALKADVSSAADVNAAFDETIRLHGQVDIVINAGAATVFAPLADMPQADVAKAIAINVQGAFNVLQAAAKRVSDGGRIIQFSTGGTKMPVFGGGVYAGTKAAGEHIALGLSRELGQRQVTVNVISPGVTDTNGLVMPQDQIDMLVSQTPLGRLGQPEDVADVVVFLASSDARWVTGQNIQANGGIL